MPATITRARRELRKRRAKVRAAQVREHQEAVATGVLFEKEAMSMLLDFMLQV